MTDRTPDVIRAEISQAIAYRKLSIWLFVAVAGNALGLVLGTAIGAQSHSALWVGLWTGVPLLSVIASGLGLAAFERHIADAIQQRRAELGEVDGG